MQDVYVKFVVLYVCSVVALLNLKITSFHLFWSFRNVEW
jgi:hypothetical protein